MGNVCCSRRAHSSINYNENNQDLQKVSEIILTEKKEVEVNNPININKESYEQKTSDGEVLEIKEINLENKPILSRRSLRDNPINEEMLNNDIGLSDKLNTANFRSVVKESLEYTLIMPEDLTKPQQNQILMILDKYKSLIQEDDQEEVDGFLYVEENKKKLMIMITTHAIYVLKPEDFSLIVRRVKLEDIFLIVLTKSKNELLFVIRGSKEDFLISSDNMENLLKSIQQVSYEAFNQYLPWINAENSAELEKMKNNVVLDNRSMFSDENLAIIKLIVENGCIGEIKIINESFIDNKDTRALNAHFILTDQAIYLADSSYGFKKRISLANIEKISINSKDKFVIIFDNTGIHEFSIPLDISNQIKETAWILEKNIIINDCWFILIPIINKD